MSKSTEYKFHPVVLFNPFFFFFSSRKLSKSIGFFCLVLCFLFLFLSVFPLARGQLFLKMILPHSPSSVLGLGTNKSVPYISQLQLFKGQWRSPIIVKIILNEGHFKGGWPTSGCSAHSNLWFLFPLIYCCQDYPLTTWPSYVNTPLVSTPLWTE